MSAIATGRYHEPMGRATIVASASQVSSIDRGELADILRALESHRGRRGPMRAAPILSPADDASPAGHEQPQPTTDILDHDQEIEHLVADLLIEHPDPARPFIVATARQVAMSLKMIANLSGTMLKMLREQGPDGVPLRKLEMLSRLKAMEVHTLGRLLLALELVKDRQVPVEVHALPMRPVRGGRHGAR